MTNVYYASTADVANGSVTFVLHSTGACTEIFDTIVVYFELPPSAEFSSSTAPYNINETINFQNESTGEVSWQWNFGDNSGTSLNENPVYSYPTNGTYPVTLIVMDDHNCMDTVVHDIDINVVALTLPTAFTPNGDGMNDVLFVKGGPFKNLELRIYNEWGNLLFMSNSQAVGWDGTYNGQDQPGGVYTYTVVATDNADKEYKLSGDVTLIK